MTNFLDKRDPVGDRSGPWRGLLLVFILFLMSGALIFGDRGWSVSDFHFSKIIEPLEIGPVVESRMGGDIVVKPPESIRPKLPELVGELPAVDSFSARSMIVKDSATGLVLYRKNEYEAWPIASITKLMSALVLLEKKPDWTATATVIGIDSLDTHVYAGDTFILEDLWLAALVGSSNKAILSLANALDWPVEAFVERMNQKARELGMTETYFTDPSGLEATNVSSASDVVILLHEALKQEKIRQALAQSEHNLYSKERKKSHHLWNTNWLLLDWIPNDLDLIGGKTGYIGASGYNFAMQTGNGAGPMVEVVVLGAESHEARFIEARDVAYAVFDNYVWP